MVYQLFTDGGSRGNPGQAACAIVIKNKDNEVIKKDSKYLSIQTNNFAEYEGLILGLNTFLEFIDNDQNNIELQIFMDSQLIVRQVEGKYKVKDPVLKDKYQEVKDILEKIENLGIKWSIKDVRREENSLADKLVNEELDKYK